MLLGLSGPVAALVPLPGRKQPAAVLLEVEGVGYFPVQAADTALQIAVEGPVVDVLDLGSLAAAVVDPRGDSQWLL